MTRRIKNRYIVPLRQKTLHQGLQTIMSFMVAIALLCMVGAVALSNFIADWRLGVQNSISISAFYPDTMDIIDQQQITDKINAVLTTTQGIQQFSMVSDMDKYQLLSHWLGDKVAKNNIILPMLWDVTIDYTANVSQLTIDIQNIYKDAVVDDYSHWKSTVLRMAQDVVILSYVLVGVMVCVSMILMSMCIRALVALQMDTIQVLTLLGASDSFILRDVGRYAFKVGLKSAVFGMIVCAVVIGTALWWYTDTSYTMVMDMYTDIYVRGDRHIILANLLRILGGCAIILTVALLSRWCAVHSAKKCIRQQYRI